MVTFPFEMEFCYTCLDDVKLLGSGDTLPVPPKELELCSLALFTFCCAQTRILIGTILICRKYSMNNT